MKQPIMFGDSIWRCLFGFLTSSSITRLYRGRVPRLTPDTRQSGETLTSVSAGHIILAPTQPVGSARPQRGSNPGPPHEESRTLLTELPRPLIWRYGGEQLPRIFPLWTNKVQSMWKIKIELHLTLLPATQSKFSDWERSRSKFQC